MALTDSDLLDRLRTAIAALRDVSAERDALLDAASCLAEPVAIIGVACRFPGKASSPEALAAFLRAGGDAVTEVPEARWTVRSGDGVAPSTHWGAFLDEVDRFDHGFFGISPREASHMDPQQRMLLEVTWEALERAGQPAAELAGSKTGVFLGVMATDYLQLSVEAPERDAYTATGNGHSFPAGRISYTFGFQGPALVVDTACSSSLVATHLGCQSLRSGESDLTIVGGVSLMLSPVTTELSAKFNGLSPDGRCKTFDARANGYVRGEGCGIAVLKRLSDAQRNGDPILATIRGSAVNQDGRSTGITTPNVLAQQALLRQALANARVSAAQIDYVETHGTGTPLGDPIEVDALREVLGAPRPDGAPCVLGAVKTNLGHLEAAAGVAGLIKIVMALQDEQIPPNLHFRGLNPRIALDGTPFVIPTAATPWQRGARARIAGVSSFGLSGTNAHVIVEEALLPAAPSAPPVGVSYLVPLSAKTPDALRALATSYAALLSAADGPSLHDVAYTAGCLRTHHEHRLAGSGASCGEVSRALAAAVEAGATRAGVAERKARRPKLVFVFPGQGSQWLGMGRQLLAQEPAFRDAFAVCDDAIRRVAGFSVLDELVTDDAHARLGDVGVLQPTLFAIEVAIARLWQTWGVEPDVVVGHSMGEVAASVVAGVLSMDDAARIICRRSDLLRRVRGRGAMAVVELSWSAAEAAVAGYAGRLSIAVSNGPRSTVLAGDPAALDELIATLEQTGVFCRRVKVDVASHSPQMDPLRDDLLAAVAEVRSTPGQIEMRSTVTGEPVTGDELGPAYWVDNLRNPVLFSQVVQGLIRDGHEIFVEISPHPILVPAIDENLSDSGGRGVAVASLRRNADERAAMLDALGTIYTWRYPVPWRRQFPHGGRCVPLPAYPWQRERHWLEQGPPRAAVESAPASDGGRGHLASALLAPVWRAAPPTTAAALPGTACATRSGPAARAAFARSRAPRCASSPTTPGSSTPRRPPTTTRSCATRSRPVERRGRSCTCRDPARRPTP
jgi:acyl transferase domain-containing protein